MECRIMTNKIYEYKDDLRTGMWGLIVFLGVKTV